VFLAILAFCYFLLPLLSRPANGWMPNTYGNLKTLTLAVLTYSNKEGVFPSDPRGEAYALYLVRDLLEGDARCLGVVPRPPEAGPEPSFDDGRAMVVNADFDYANIARPPSDYDFIILAEKVFPGMKVRYYSMLDGQIIVVDPRQAWAKGPLVGRRARDVCSGGAKEGPGPSGGEQ
jgi:hypothetical protein